jgi:hypothetical protein
MAHYHSVHRLSMNSIYPRLSRYLYMTCIFTSDQRQDASIEDETESETSFTDDDNSLLNRLGERMDVQLERMFSR